MSSARSGSGHMTSGYKDWVRSAFDPFGSYSPHQHCKLKINNHIRFYTDNNTIQSLLKDQGYHGNIIPSIAKIKWPVFSYTTKCLNYQYHKNVNNDQQITWGYVKIEGNRLVSILQSVLAIGFRTNKTKQKTFSQAQFPIPVLLKSTLCSCFYLAQMFLVNDKLSWVHLLCCSIMFSRNTRLWLNSTVGQQSTTGSLQDFVCILYFHFHWLIVSLWENLIFSTCL